MFRPLATEFLARLTEDGILVMIVDTLRTIEEHTDNLTNGTSWTQRSLHLDGLAIDVAPYSQYKLHGGNKLQWDSEDSVWTKIGRVAERVGLDWGGRWQNHPDLGHVEHPRGRRLSQLGNN